jgi:hypothetical protein
LGCLPVAYRQQNKKLAQAAGLWASGQLDTSHKEDDDAEFDNAAAALGLQPEEDTSAPAPVDTFYFWPESLPLWAIWQCIQTLWRVGMQGREGLDYAGLCVYLREVERIKPRRFAETFACLQAMEQAALVEWAKQAKKSSP